VSKAQIECADKGSLRECTEKNIKLLHDTFQIRFVILLKKVAYLKTQSHLVNEK